jgi:hypothetical protein
MNNDGDLIVSGEAITGFLPRINGLREKAGSPEHYCNHFEGLKCRKCFVARR